MCPHSKLRSHQVSVRNSEEVNRTSQMRVVKHSENMLRWQLVALDVYAVEARRRGSNAVSFIWSTGRLRSKSCFADTSLDIGRQDGTCGSLAMSLCIYETVEESATSRKGGAE